ncbi:hypothetical protein STEG23_027809 [Scotinomys teguina]
MPLIQVFEWQSQVDLCEFEASLVYRTRSRTVATAITALAFYFGPFGNPNNTTIIIRTDGGSSQDPCTSASTPSLTSTPSLGPETTPSSTVTTPGSPTIPPTPTTTVMSTATTEHEVEIEDNEKV